MKTPIFGELNTFEVSILCTLMPTVFVFLWSLITGDIKNFGGSRIAYTEYTAKDPINCYNYVREKKKDT